MGGPPVKHSFSASILSAVQLTRDNSPLERISYGKRTVNQYELELIDWGRGEILTQGEPLATVGGRLFIRWPGMEVEGFTPYFSYYVTFSAENSGLEQLSLPAYMDDMGFLRPWFQTICAQFTSTQLSATLKMQGALCSILTEVLERLTVQMPPEFQQSVSYIRQNLAKPLQVTQLADKAGYSLNHYTRLFRHYMHVTPARYILTCRIERACELLGQTRLPVEQIAAACGFDSVSYFYRTFKMLKGNTPARYRQHIHTYQQK